MVSFSSQDMKQQNNRSSVQYDLHSVHSASRILKKPLASLAPTVQQPKVYKVKPIHFRELVQKLTGFGAALELQNHQTKPQPQPQPRHISLQSVAPPPLPLQPHQLRVQNQTNMNTVTQQVPHKIEPVEQKSLPAKIEAGEGSIELTLSPNFQAWFAFTMMSPGAATVSQMEQR